MKDLASTVAKLRERLNTQDNRITAHPLFIVQEKFNSRSEHWCFVTAHFTAHEADFFITQNRHNLNQPRVYVTSQNRCWEWNAIVEGLKSGAIGVVKPNTEVDSFKSELACWLTNQWDSCVKNRPLVNIHRRTLCDTFHNLFRRVTGEEMPRPRHDDQLSKGDMEQ